MYDVIIVGGGVTGAYLASKLNGLNVLLIEKNKKVILKDSGIVSADFLNLFDPALVKHEIHEMEFFSPSGHSFTLRSEDPFAYIIKRTEFSRDLKSSARKNATVVYENTIGVTYDKDFVTVHTTGGSFHGKLVVGADGANSIVRKYAKIPKPFLSLGIMVKTKRSMEGKVNVFFNKYYSPNFFSWIIPQNNEYGTISDVRPREYLDYFKKQYHLPEGYIAANLIPTGYVRSYANRTILVGDACGQNKPLTGGGIMFGLKAAIYASTTISDAFDRGRFDAAHLKQYESMWKKDFAWEIDKQFLARMLYRNLTNKQIDKVFLQIGPSIEKLNNFDYDKFSKAWIKMPKIAMLKTAFLLATGML
ncbi:MAG: NAD(P)/FAD-dependent oxidoreductase [Candidatus Aenigmatarchaeota archaeon]